MFWLSRWDEVSLVVSMLPTPGQTVSQEGDKTIWRDAHKQVRFYELSTSTDLPEGGYEIDVVYDRKPASNVVRMNIETTNLDFFYQPPLDEEKHDANIASCEPTKCFDHEGRVMKERPENIVGSYAVYYKDGKSGDYTLLSGKNYRAGKAFHIYRPKITDNAGKSVWGDLNIDTNAGTMTVIVPQKFLDTATYPVIVDPTFGWNKIGGTSSAWNTGNIGTDGKYYQPTTDGRAISMFLYGRSYYGGTVNVQTALYRKNGSDTSGTFIGWTGTSSALTGTDGWAHFTVRDYPYVYATGDGYNQAFNPEDWIVRYYDTSQGTPYHKEDVQTYGTWPSAITWDVKTGQERWSLYTSYADFTTPPKYVRIAIYQLDTSNGAKIGSALRVEDVDLDFYVKHVLANEWGNMTNAPEALKAGAMAIKNYIWYWFLNPTQSWKWADCDNSISCQVYNPYLSYASTDAAVDFMFGTGMYQNGVIFQSQYCAGSYDSTNPCGSNKMSQLGSEYLDEQLDYNWQQILAYYYEPDPTYFNIAPRSQWTGTTYQSSGSSNSITFTYSSASSTPYEIWKWNGSAWAHLATTSSLTYTDSGLTSNQTYYYTVYPYGNGKKSAATFNNGYIAAVAKSASNPPAPITNVLAIATSTVKLYATSTVSSILEYQVDKWNGSSWVNVVATTSPQVVTQKARSDGGIHIALPNVYIDKTADAGSGLRYGIFVYTDTGLTANTAYYYRIRIRNSTGWSDYSNFGGYVTTITAQIN